MKINKCPFCNSDFVGTCVSLPEPNLLHQVTCHACNAEGPTRDTERKAVNSWNKAGERIAILEEREQLLYKLTEAVKLQRDEQEREAFIARAKQKQRERLQVEDADKKCSHTFDNPRCPHC